MKRIIGINIIALLLVISFIGIGGYGTLNTNAIFYDNMTGINISAKADILGNTTVLEHFAYISEKYGVYVAKYIFRNENTVSVYSMDTDLSQKIKLKSGRYPANEDEYITNSQWDNIRPTGIFWYFEPNARIVVYPIGSLEKMGGFDGVFYISTTDSNAVNDIISYLNGHVGPTELFYVYDTNILKALMPLLETSVNNSPILLIFGLVCGLVFIFTIIRYAVTQSRAIAILRINGFSFGEIIGYYLRELFGTLGFGFGASSLTIAVYILIKHGVYYLADFIVVNILCFCGLALLLFLVLAVAFSIQTAACNKVQTITGAKSFRLLPVLQLGLKYGIYVFVLFSLVLIRQYQSDLVKKAENDDVWRQAQNVYAVVSKYVTEDMKVRRDYELRAYEVYKDWEEHLNGFLINADNYNELSDGRYIYNANTENGRFGLYSPAGLSITVNENYLNRHPVISAETGTDTLNGIKHDPYIENILVPVSLRQYEDEIYANFLEGFAFQKIEIGNKYNRELGLPDVPYTTDDLKINIIYVEDGTKYFTYNPLIKGDNQNQITDPIVIVDTGNVDYSYYFSYLTGSCLYESDNIEPVADLMPYAARHNMQSVYNSVYSMYSVRAQEIQATMKKLQDTVIVEILLLIGFILSIYLYNACYYEKNKYIFIIKRLHGYGFFRLNGKMIMLNFLLSLIAVMPFEIEPYFKIALLLADMFFTIVFGSYMGQKSFMKIIKGEH